MKHIQLFESFNKPNADLSIELEYKVRTLPKDSEFTVDDFFDEYGIKGSNFGWAAILNGSEKYKDMSDEEFKQVYTEYKNGESENIDPINGEDMWEKFTKFLDEEDIDIYESYDDIYNKFMETINDDLIEDQSNEITFYISKECGISDDEYSLISNFLEELLS